jgi:hypothetical protein
MKLFTGDYLTGLDLDDYYRSQLLFMVDALCNLPNEYGMVRCDAMLTDENTQ